MPISELHVPGIQKLTIFVNIYYFKICKDFPYINFFSFINTPSLVGWGFTLEMLFLRCLFSVVPFPHILQQNKQMSFNSHRIVHSENMWEWPQVSDHVMKGTGYINNFIYVYMLFFICIWPVRGWSGKKILEKISLYGHFIIWLQQSISMSRLKLVSNNWNIHKPNIKII